MPHFAQNDEDLSRLFASHHIPTDQPAFYDHPNFIAIEQTDPQFLNCYASFVRQRPRTAEYDNKVKEVVPRIAAILHRELVAEGRLGACMDMSAMLSRILEKEGIWNYIVKGALTLRFPDNPTMEPQYFWSIDTQPNTSHAWVAVPPFDVIDLTVKQQPYKSQRIPDRLPDYVLLDTMQPYTPEVEDICSAEIRQQAKRQGRPIKDLHFTLDPNLRDVFASFPANEKRINQVLLRYSPCAFTVPGGPLEALKAQRWNGRYAHELYEELIRQKG